jgi:hypothetical protein
MPTAVIVGEARDAGRDGAGAAPRHRRLDARVLPGAHLTPLEQPKPSRLNLQRLLKCSRLMKFTGELTVWLRGAVFDAPRTRASSPPRRRARPRRDRVRPYAAVFRPKSRI